MTALVESQLPASVRTHSQVPKDELEKPSPPQAQTEDIFEGPMVPCSGIQAPP